METFHDCPQSLPKTKASATLNDLRPVALTSLIMTLERLIKNEVLL